MMNGAGSNSPYTADIHPILTRMTQSKVCPCGKPDCKWFSGYPVMSIDPESVKRESDYAWDGEHLVPRLNESDAEAGDPWDAWPTVPQQRPTITDCFPNPWADKHAILKRQLGSIWIRLDGLQGELSRLIKELK